MRRPGASIHIVFGSIALLAFGAGVPPVGRGSDAASEALHYRFELAREPELRVRIGLEATGNQSGETTFELSREWGGVTAGGEDVSAVRIFDARGAGLSFEHPEPHRWRVRHPPNERLTIEYEFAPNTHQSEDSPEMNRRPILNEHLFHAYGNLALMLPAHFDPRVVRPVSFVWEGFETAGWKVADSFGVGSGRREFEVSIEKLSSSVLLAGELELVRRDVEGRPVWSAVAGSWSFTPDAFADLVQKVVSLERGFFRDHDYPYYLVTAIPVGKVQEGSRSLGGTGLTNSFALAMMPNTELEGRFGRGFDVAGLLAHEMFHNWDGHTIVPEDPEQLVYWFTEGFTDFYTRRLLFRGGLITREEYLEAANAKIADLLTSPAGNAPNERIRAEFWRADAVRRLPYLRGDVVAMLVDGAIRHTTSGKSSLDDLMRDLVREGRETQERFTTEELLRRIEERTSEKFAGEIRAVLVDGAMPEIDPRTFEPCFEVRKIDIGPFDLGFDFDRSRKEGKVVGVRAGSNAAAAGLRDGQPLHGWSVHNGDTSKPVEMRIDGPDAKEKVLTWMPLGPTIPAPQFAPRAGASARDCGCL